MNICDLSADEIKIELEKRNISKVGPKSSLVNRLKKALLDEGIDPDTHLLNVPENTVHPGEDIEIDEIKYSNKLRLNENNETDMGSFAGNGEDIEIDEIKYSNNLRLNENNETDMGSFSDNDVKGNNRISSENTNGVNTSIKLEVNNDQVDEMYSPELINDANDSEGSKTINFPVCISKFNNPVNSTKPNKYILSCTTCDYTASDKINLENHTSSVHWKEKPLFCKYCDYNTPWKNFLNEHMKIHKEEKKCPFCDFTCEVRHKLHRHIIKVHVYNKGDSLSCKLCNFSTKIKSFFSKHLIVQHKEEKPLFCPLCCYYSISRSDVKKHLVSVHQIHFALFVCDICDYSCLSKSSIEKHMPRSHKL